MRRLVIPIMFALVAGACAQGAVEPVDQGPVVLPSGEAQLVASYTHDGGIILPAYQLIDPPRVLVYSDGRVIADARRTLTLTADELSSLVGALRRDLAGLEGIVRSRRAEQIMDAATSVIKVLAPDLRLKSVSAYALDEGHPAGLLAARDRLNALVDRVVRDGDAYTNARVRLVAYPNQDLVADTGQTTAWPGMVAIPPPGGQSDEGARWVDLSGEAARVVAATMPGGPSEDPFTRVLAASDGQTYRVGWRYLTPED